MIFRDKERQLGFEKNGYVKVEFPNKAELSDLKEFAKEFLPSKRPVIDFAESLNYYISIFDKDPNHKKKADEVIGGFVKSLVEQELNSYECFVSNFMIKYPEDDVLECHQDFNLVDEELYTGFNLWAPLQNTNTDNGGLYILPGSHKIENLYRGPNIPFSFTTYNQQLMAKCIPVTVNEGECLIFDHKTIHFSTTNPSENPRYAIQSVLKPIEADPLLYVFDETNSSAVGKLISKEFALTKGFWSSEIGELPTLHERPYKNPLDLSQVQELIR